MKVRKDDPRVLALQAKIDDSTQKALWAFRFIYEQQTDAEKFTGEDLGIRDNKGFQPHATARMNELYERLEARNWLLTAAEADQLRAVMQRYAHQIVRLTVQEKAKAKERETA